MQSTLDLALEYREERISCLPIKSNEKVPVGEWKHLQDKMQTPEELERVFAGHQGNIAFITGSASENLACLDIEDKGLFEEFSQEFTLNYGETWMVKSRRGGHILFRTRQPAKARTHFNKGRKYEVRGQKQYNLAPPSIYRDKGTDFVYQFENRPQSIAVVEAETFFPLDYIEAENSEIIQPLDREINLSLGLDGCLAVFIEKANNGKEYQTLSGYDYAVILALTNRGVPFETVRKAFRKTEEATHYGRLWKEKGEREADRNLKTSYDKASRQEDTPEYIKVCEEAKQKAAAIREAIHGRPNWWRGAGKDTDKAVLLAHVAQFEKCKKSPWNLSERDGAELAEVGHVTFGKGNNRLIKGGFLARVNRSIKLSNIAASYEFGDMLKNIPKLAYTLPTTVCIWSYENIDSIETHGVFERSVFGKRAKDIYQSLLVDGPMSQSEMRLKVGASQGTISKKCNKLGEYSIICKIGTKYHADPNFDFKKLSDDLEASLINERRKKVHRADGQRFGQKVEWFKSLSS